MKNVSKLVRRGNAVDVRQAAWLLGRLLRDLLEQSQKLLLSSFLCRHPRNDHELALDLLAVVESHRQRVETTWRCPTETCEGMSVMGASPAIVVQSRVS